MIIYFPNTCKSTMSLNKISIIIQNINFTKKPTNQDVFLHTIHYSYIQIQTIIHLISLFRCTCICICLFNILCIITLSDLLVLPQFCFDRHHNVIALKFGSIHQLFQEFPLLLFLCNKGRTHFWRICYSSLKSSECF